MFVMIRPVKYKLGDLPALYACAICALGRTLKLKRYRADCDFAHAFLPKIA